MRKILLLFFILASVPAGAQLPDSIQRAGTGFLLFDSSYVLCDFSFRVKKDFYRTVNSVMSIKSSDFSQLHIVPAKQVCAKDKVFDLLSSDSSCHVLVKVVSLRSMYDGNYLWKFYLLNTNTEINSPGAILSVGPAGRNNTVVRLKCNAPLVCDSVVIKKSIEEFVEFLK